MRTRALIAGFLALGLGAALPASRAQDERVGTETCAGCHEEVVSAFRLTPHAVAPGWERDFGCEACHGPGQTHAEGEVDAIVRPETLPPRESSEICLDCHVHTEKQFVSRHSDHSLGQVSCVDCHDPHSKKSMLIERRGIELCAPCHASTAAEFEMPRAHPLAEGAEACASCHEPHSATSVRERTGFGNETCGNCHFDKTLPFLYPHDVGLVRDCTACHEVHGNPNRHLLQHTQQVMLCYQCHPAVFTPTFHNAANFVNEKCTACHTAIHGSNTSPAFLEE